MWYEILPSLAILTAAITAPTILTYYNQKLFQSGNPYRRSMDCEFNRRTYQRDVRLNGNPYKDEGLDAIPDE